MTLSSLSTDHGVALVLIALATAVLAVSLVLHYAKNDPGWKGVVANILVILGGITVIAVIAVLSLTFIAVALMIGVVLLFMAPLFLLGGASGLGDRRPRRGYYRDPYGNDYY
jgi:hypothetical protein